MVSTRNLRVEYTNSEGDEYKTSESGDMSSEGGEYKNPAGALC